MLVLKINLRKCEIIPVGEVEDIENLASIMNCKVGVLPTTYLRLSFGASNKDQATWNLVLLRVKKRLAG